MKENYFADLYRINVNEKTEKKNSMTYLSWAYAWAEIKKRFPDATYTVYEDGNGCFYHTDGRTCWVKTGVIVNELEHIEYLPVMDYRNKSIPLENVTSYDVNKAIQRSLTKACARHGLGLYIYAGEDLPEEARYTCTCCGKELTAVKYHGNKVPISAIVKRTQARYGKVLCWACAEQEAKQNAASTVSNGTGATGS